MIFQLLVSENALVNSPKESASRGEWRKLHKQSDHDFELYNPKIKFDFENSLKYHRFLCCITRKICEVVEQYGRLEYLFMFYWNYFKNKVK